MVRLTLTKRKGQITPGSMEVRNLGSVARVASLHPFISWNHASACMVGVTFCKQLKSLLTKAKS